MLLRHEDGAASLSGRFPDAPEIYFYAFVTGNHALITLRSDAAGEGSFRASGMISKNHDVTAEFFGAMVTGQANTYAVTCRLEN